MSERDLKRYKKTLGYSYAPGAFCCYELIDSRPRDIRAIYIHSEYYDGGALERRCIEASVPVARDDRAFRVTGQKENCLAFAVFDKYTQSLERDAPHLCLVNPGDMGNLGTIIRTMAGFGVRSLAIITPAADLFDPKTIRASMGAVFRINASLFNSFEAYREMFPDHACFPFMTDGETMLEPEASERLSAYPYTLIFGNEAAGLDTRFKDCGIAVKIPQTGLVDSLNLSVCAGIGLYCFTSLQRQ